MRVTPRELQAVRRAGMLTRYAFMGPVAYVLADLPAEGTGGTGLENPCLVEHHGIVLRGTFRTHHEDGRVESYEAGTAFYVPEGPPPHQFTWTSGAVVGGFVPVDPSVAVDRESLEQQGYDVVRRPRLPDSPPRSVTLAGSVQPFKRAGSIEVEGSVMGRWLFMRSRFGARTIAGGGWCQLPHWGVVLDGDLAIHTPEAVELATAGDAFYVDPNHRFEAADGATVLDYTPIDSLATDVRVAPWRRDAIERARERGVLAAVGSVVAGEESDMQARRMVDARLSAEGWRAGVRVRLAPRLAPG